jgi:5-methylcytosine-specific restriction enzyme A
LDRTNFVVGRPYSRKDVWNALGIPDAERGGDWLTGYHRHGDDYFIFCNVGVPGRTGHDYGNHWEGERLVWFGKTSSRFKQGSINALTSGECRVLIFYRVADRAPFTFAGVGHPVPHLDIESPVRIDWTFGSDEINETPVFTDEYVEGALFKEGQRTQVLVNRYERDRRARDECVRHFGTACSVCGVDMEARYGELGRGFIHVHHIVQLRDIGSDYEVDPRRDLIPVCPNCHAMLHRRNPPLEIAELRERLLRSDHDTD